MSFSNQIFSVGVFIFLALLPATTFAADVTPHIITDIATPLYFDTGDPDAYTFAVFSPDGQQELTTERGANNGHTWAELIDVYDEGTYHALLQGTLYNPCMYLTYTECLADPSYLGVDVPLFVKIDRLATSTTPQIKPVPPLPVPLVVATSSPVNISSNIPVKFAFIHDLTVSSVGDDVKALQIWLNAHGYPVASSGAGSLGNETNYFGERTRIALAQFQKARGIMPTVGYFGPKTRKAINAN